MIGHLAGRIAAIAADHVIVDVGGVGYRLACSARTVAALGETGRETRLLVETFIRDERIVLYGFLDAAEQQGFRLLMEVQGVGPRVALAVLSVLGLSELALAVRANDSKALTRASGVGPRLARRIVTELGDRVDGIEPAVSDGAAVPAGGVEEDAVGALVHLGYARPEAWGAVTRARRGMADGSDVAALIAASLRELAR